MEQKFILFSPWLLKNPVEGVLGFGLYCRGVRASGSELYENQVGNTSKVQAIYPVDSGSSGFSR